MRKFKFIGILLGFCALASAVLLQSMPAKNTTQKKVEQAKQDKEKTPKEQTEVSILDSFLPANVQLQLHFEFSFISEIFTNHTQDDESPNYTGTKLSPGKYLDVLLTALISPNAP